MYQPMEHNALSEEMEELVNMPVQERIQLAKQRRIIQLLAEEQRERARPPPRPRRPRLRFNLEVEWWEATTRGDEEEVESLLEEGVDPNVHNDEGLTALHQCAIDDNETLMMLLLQYGANVNAEDTEKWTPLHAAACCAHLNAVKILIENGADLLAMDAEGSLPFDVCEHEPTLVALEVEMAKKGYTQEYIDERRAAPEKAMLEDMKALRQQSAPLDVRMSDRSTYLHVAACLGYYDVAAFLLRCGIQANVRDNDSWQPLHAAAFWGQCDLVELLCEYKADVNSKTSTGETPLDLARDNETRSIISQLQQQEARRRRHAFGVRDSRRQSRKRKKFESPQPLPPVTGENPFSARGAIRRQSLRDKSGMTPARIEAAREEANILRSWSKEDVSNSDVSTVPQANHTVSPSKRILKGSVKTKPMSSDEWLKKLENNEEEDETSPRRAGSQRRRTKKGNGGPIEMQDLRPNGDPSSREKRGCCCVIC